MHGKDWHEDFWRRTHRRLRAWGVNTIGNWSEVALMASVTPPDTARAKEDLLALHELLADKYFSHIAARIKARAPNKLYLGCRFAYWGGPAAWRAAARHCDVVSFNTYREKPFEDLPPESVDKPILIGEFHFGAYDRGMFWPGCAMARDQRERADAYRRFQEAVLRHPRYVGAHWFQWQDQTLTARGGGENGQVGFVNIADQPYPELIDAARDIGRRMYPLRWRK